MSSHLKYRDVRRPFWSRVIRERWEVIGSCSRQILKKLSSPTWPSRTPGKPFRQKYQSIRSIGISRDVADVAPLPSPGHLDGTVRARLDRFHDHHRTRVSKCVDQLRDSSNRFATAGLQRSDLWGGESRFLGCRWVGWSARASAEIPMCTSDLARRQ